MRVHRYLRETGLPVQYSVFTLMMTPKQQSAMVQGLRGLIDRRKDDVRIYPLPANGERVTLGQRLFPDDILRLAARATYCRPPVLGRSRVNPAQTGR
ncbi:MAG: CRISPR-associated protein Cas2 [Proteobacteria bacterium]|nr:CRISPR-associated protein Cas2 [Pseudomonadota bacterium]